MVIGTETNPKKCVRFRIEGRGRGTARSRAASAGPRGRWRYLIRKRSTGKAYLLFTVQHRTYSERMKQKTKHF